MKEPIPPSIPVPRTDHPNVLPLQGEIDLHVSPAVAAVLAGMIEKKPPKVVVDLSGVSYLDSSGLAILI
ncbi:MAG: STAS domain-containing protein, partial [Verrucomicrobiota bacterium]